MFLRRGSLALALLGFIACRPAALSIEPSEPSACEAFAWLEGVWAHTSDGVTTQERWRRSAAGLEGDHRVSKAGQRVFEETMRIELAGGTAVYRAAPAGQPPHDFPLRACEGQRAVFSDPAHDFPQTLDYRRQGDTLFVIARGEADGQPREARWTWTLVADE